ncbi:unnamed protein product, partial [Tilletia controversa]
GLSAAIGKTGAAVGVQTFRPIQDSLGKKWIFIIAAIVGVLGIIIAYFFVPDTTKLDFETEDEAWRQYLLANGWNHEMGDGSSVGPSHLASDMPRDEKTLGRDKGLLQDEEDASASSETGKGH